MSKNEKTAEKRQIKNYKGRSSRIGVFASTKSKDEIAIESQIERDYAFRLDFDPDVESFCSQQPRTKYIWNGVMRTYTPDFFVKRTGSRKESIEVKPDDILLDSERMNDYKVIANVFAEKGVDFKLVTESDIRKQPSFNNTKLLHRYSRQAFSITEELECLNFVSRTGDVSIGDMVKNDIAVEIVYALLYKHKLVCDMEHPITYATKVWAQSESDAYV